MSSDAIGPQFDSAVRAAFDATEFDTTDDLSYYYCGYIEAEGWIAITRRLIEAGVVAEVGP